MSGALPFDVQAALSLGMPDILRPRFWAGESVRCTATFTDPATAAPVDVDGVVYAFRYPNGAEVIAPIGTAVRIGIGVWACAIVPALPGEWSVVVRSLVPTMAVDVCVFDVVALPAGAQPPPPRLVTSDDGLFLLLSPDGAAITY